MQAGRRHGCQPHHFTLPSNLIAVKKALIISCEIWNRFGTRHSRRFNIQNESSGTTPGGLPW
jgi:hypothetical protein